MKALTATTAAAILTSCASTTARFLTTTSPALAKERDRRKIFPPSIAKWPQALRPSKPPRQCARSEGRFDSGSGHATDWQQEWNLKYGWNRPGDEPVLLDAAYTTIRKVEIHDVYDLDRWWWKATDGIRETTWPGVYNRSRLIGRDDYYELPDWDCYSLSGKAVTFYMPNEPWNHLEIAGGAWGNMSLLSHDMEKGTDSETHCSSSGPRVRRPRITSSTRPSPGGKIRFTNVEQEQPIGELSAYYVHPGMEPTGVDTLHYQAHRPTAPPATIRRRCRW